MQKSCTHCSATYQITEDDLEFLKRVSPIIADKRYDIPPPALCPDCRLQRRLAHRIERKLYHRKCDLTGKQILSTHAPEKDVVVYEKNEWWGDRWDPLTYGREVDFSRSFVDQLTELQRVVPRMSLQQENNQNSDYTSNVSNLKNCYLLFTSDFSQDCAYGIWVERSRNCLDTFCIDECEQSYECIFCQKLYGCRFAFACSDCSDCSFILDCRGCKNCLMCWGLRNKEHCIANVQYSKEEYQQKLKEFSLSSRKNLDAARTQFEELLKTTPRPAMRKHGSVIDSTGDLLQNCGNCRNCYELRESRDCVNSIGFKAADARDCSYVMGELGYENCECFPTPHHSAFNINCYSGADLYYCDLCMLNCKNCFGCVSLKRAEYCILNKQYTKDEYEALVPKIIKHMQTLGEWGEFIKIQDSIFRYNESEAQDYFPVTKEQALKEGISWSEEEQEKEKYMGPTAEVPDDIKDVDDAICQKILLCGVTGRPYKIIPQELKFYRTIGIPIPRKCPDQRHKERMAQRNPRKLWDRQCAKCHKSIETTYAPERSEVVYCEECYLSTVY